MYKLFMAAGFSLILAIAATTIDKAVFKATFQQDGQDHTVIVKFTPKYCARGHEIAGSMDSAPKLWFCEVVEALTMISFTYYWKRLLDHFEAQLLRCMMPS